MVLDQFRSFYDFSSLIYNKIEQTESKNLRPNFNHFWPKIWQLTTLCIWAKTAKTWMLRRQIKTEYDKAIVLPFYFSVDSVQIHYLVAWYAISFGVKTKAKKSIWQLDCFLCGKSVKLCDFMKFFVHQKKHLNISSMSKYHASKLRPCSQGRPWKLRFQGK